MKAVSVKPVRFKEDGTREVEAIIIADEMPDPLPVTGENVDGLNANDVFAPFSVLFIVGDASSKVCVANESGQFIAQ